MRTSVFRLLGAALVAGVAGGVLAGCAENSTTHPPDVPTVQTSPTDPSADLPTVRPDSVPLGLEVRYVDENGKFATVAPEDFPR